MTTKEVIQAMLDGKKVRRVHWQIGVFLYFDSPYFVNQDRNICDTFKDSNDWTFYEEPKQKQVVVIEKWLIYNNLFKSYSIAEESNIEEFLKDDKAYLSKVKLLDTYEVEI